MSPSIVKIAMVANNPAAGPYDSFPLIILIIMQLSLNPSEITSGIHHCSENKLTISSTKNNLSISAIQAKDLRMNVPKKNYSPADFSRRILFTACGLAPQVITETLYAIAQENPAEFPTELWIVTTLAGRKQIIHHLLDNKQLEKLVTAYDLPSLEFNAEHIRVITNPEGKLLDDIQTHQDNTYAGNLILSLLQVFTDDPHCAVHVSLAGGRKTLSYFAGYSLSICGRIQDRLSHVLVSPEFEMNRAFFFPPPVSIELPHPRDPNIRISTDDANVQLAYIPFVRIADLSQGKTATQANFSDAVAAANADTNSIQLNTDTKTLFLAGIKVPLQPAQFAWYSWYVMMYQKKQRISASAPEHLNDFLIHYKQLYGTDSSKYDTLEQNIAFAISHGAHDFIHIRNSSVKASIAKSLPLLAENFIIQGYPRKPHKEYGLSDKIGHITIV